MNFKLVKDLVTSKVGRQALKVRKHSPVILFGAGIIGVIGTAVLASRATLRLEEILEDANDELDMVREAEVSDYTEDDRQRDLAVVYAKATVKIARAYAPAVGLGILSIAALTGSHVILSKRNAALTAAYALLDRGFRDYRARVEAEYGSDKERELRYGLEGRDVFDDELQKVVTVKDVMPKNGSVYARCFDETNQNWQKQDHYNQFFLASQQQYCNDMLRARGHLFLNEVYDMLGMDRTKAGAVVGWIWNPCDGEPPQGDGYVDFGIFVGDRQSGLRFAKGVENSVWLDFNVDGVIYDKI